MKDNKKINQIIKYVSIGFYLGLFVIALVGYKKGIFDSVDSLRDFISSFGSRAPLVFTFMQVVQVVTPGIPGGMTLAIGVILFGPLVGFFTNYIGICIGSIINYNISKKYGKDIVINIFGEEKFDKYSKWLNNDKYEKFFKIAIPAPGFPDDFLCYLTGLTDMKYSTFLKVIIIGKIPYLVVYSLAFEFGISRLTDLFLKK